jgi:hypothetical protein
MKKLLLLFLLIAGSTPSWATAYFISSSGSDGNDGLSSGAPWLSPNHALNCGDIISAATGTYSAANFTSGKWGTVTCPSSNNVAWIICATFDGCKISNTSGDAMWITASYWGVVGWEATTSVTTNGACFHIGPSGNTVIHHVIMADDIANGCMGGGFTAYDHSTTGSVDYIVYIGDIAYNAAQGTGACYSGLNVYQPIAFDTNAGTHMLIAGSFSWANVDGSTCYSGTSTTDGEGINFDTWDFDQGGGTAYKYQGVIENNIEFLNGTRGIEVENNITGGAGNTAPIYIQYNTMYGSGRDTHMAFPSGLAELGLVSAATITAKYNLIYSGFQYVATGSTNNWYAMGMTSGDNTSVVDSNYAAGVSGNNTYLQSSGTFAYGGSNTLGTNPSFSSASNPGAPSCGAFSSVATCMATVVSNFAPSASGASAYGYQAPTTVSVVDPLFPQWLCTATAVLNTNIPTGLITPGCGSVSSPPVINYNGVFSNGVHI